MPLPMRIEYEIVGRAEGAIPRLNRLEHATTPIVRSMMEEVGGDFTSR